MTRPELHALVDIVMDARERANKVLTITTLAYGGILVGLYTDVFCSHDYPTFSDFTQAVNEYIKTLEG